VLKPVLWHWILQRDKALFSAADWQGVQELKAQIFLPNQFTGREMGKAACWLNDKKVTHVSFGGSYVLHRGF
jgi:hypothetical protein